MTPPKGHNHKCWVQKCQGKAHYHKGVWHSFCRSHLQLHGLGPFKKSIRHEKPSSLVIEKPKFPDGYDPNTFVDSIPVANQGLKLATIKQIKQMLTNRKINK